MCYIIINSENGIITPLSMIYQVPNKYKASFKCFTYILLNLPNKSKDRYCYYSFMLNIHDWRIKQKFSASKMQGIS